ncbi:hypothetical protein MHU86_2084 [Fragilaria crotonensis]|nr:hypothetical protein MHU86_2084 [Fragilaria crotonensis]
MVRWIGGPHVNAHLNVSTILATLKPIVDPDIYSDVSRILTFGAPALCQAEASEENFQAYLRPRRHCPQTSKAPPPVRQQFSSRSWRLRHQRLDQQEQRTQAAFRRILQAPMHLALESGDLLSGFDRYTGDDDVQCAFPRIKYNPNLVAMHSAISNNTLMMNTGLTFGDNTQIGNLLRERDNS